MGRRPCCSKDAGLNRGAWTPMEDKILTEFIKTHGEGQWRSLPERAGRNLFRAKFNLFSMLPYNFLNMEDLSRNVACAGLKRCGKSCRLRWMNYLRPDIKRGSITTEEDDLIIRLHKLLGNRWSLIAGRLPGRTDNEIKNYWHTKLGKKINHQSGQNRESLKNRSLTKKQKHCAPKPRQNNDVKTSVIRTKAIRCTKPVILIPSPAESEGEKVHDQFDQSSSTSSPATSAEIDPLADSLMKVEGNDELDFVIDFEMDQHLLSDFLNTDWSDQSYYGGDQSRSDGNIYTSSPSTSDETLLFPSEETPSLRSDFESVDFPIEIGQWESWLQA